MPQRHLSSVSLVEQCLLGAVALALVAMLSLPAARSAGATFGWMPFWLLALPLMAWATARALRQRRHRECALPTATVHAISAARPRVQASQALRRAA
jgi:BarA-like signal transduction histidine kinase